jgi:ABC-2 type transport system permease protein
MTSLVGVGRLARFVVRRDRLRLVLWVAGLTVVALASAASLRSVYDTQAKIETYVRLFGDNPALVAFAGPGYGFDDPNLGVVLVNEVQLWGAVAAALMAIFLVARNTRAEEDHERVELVRSAVVGRHAPTAAATIVVAAAELVLGAAIVLGLVALGYPAVGSVAVAGSMVAVGLVFVGVGALCAQLLGTSRGALGLAALVLAGAFVVRAVGDIGDNALRWASPIGWAQGVRAFAGERWAPLVACLLLAAGLVVAAFALSAHRDLGAGVLATRPGPASAPPAMRTPLGLVRHLARGALAGWVLGILLAGAVYGSITDDVEQMLVDNPQLADYLARLSGATITDAYLAAAATMLAVVTCGWAVSASLTAHTEEVAGRADLLLSTPTTRPRWLGAHVAVAAAGSVVVLVASGLGIGVGAAVVVGDADLVLEQVGAALARLPAVLVLVGATTLLVAVVPRLAALAWALLAVVAVVAFLADALDLPAWIRSVSPFHHLAETPAEPLSWWRILAMTAGAAVLIGVSMVAIRRRDLSVV